VRLQNSGASFVAADVPGANSFTVGVVALVAQQEREAISTRTRAALAAAKAIGVVLGGLRDHTLPSKAAAAASTKVRAAMADQRARDVLISVEHAKSNAAVSPREIAAYLSAEGISALRDGVWSAVQVKRVIERS
jgi:DNA invertase Pin-like site-specific DNA recombinase